jgi:hypothetical protein
VVDHLPLADRPTRPRPRLRTLSLLVGRITTIKLAYWAVLTAAELFLPRSQALSYAVAAVSSVLALAWAAWSARTIDLRAGGLYRSLPTIATTFVAATVVASPASLPLLLVERARSLEGCVPAGTTCAFAPLALWLAALVVGTILVPVAFAVALRPLRSVP